MTEGYFETFRRWFSPEELERARRELGSPDDIIDRNRRLEEMLRAADQRDHLWWFMKQVGVALAALLGVAVTLRTLLPPGLWPW